jgi:6-pyruvoyl-tetrahydropterin synthase
MCEIIRWIKVSTSFRGLHCWPECPYDSVAFLRSPHRHTFHVEVKVQVEHHDREVEFFRFQHDVDRVIKSYLLNDYDGPEPVDLGRMSCEEITEIIFSGLKEVYPNRKMVISVSEDGEVAAEIEFREIKRVC